jgi:hypothetical protein
MKAAPTALVLSLALTAPPVGASLECVLLPDGMPNACGAPWLGEAMLEFCQHAIDLFNGERSAFVGLPAHEAGQCIGFLNAIAVLNPHSCTPINTGSGQLVTVFVKYVKAHPETLRHEASRTAMSAFAESWPCPGPEVEER